MGRLPGRDGEPEDLPRNAVTGREQPAGRNLVRNWKKGLEKMDIVRPYYANRRGVIP